MVILLSGVMKNIDDFLNFCLKIVHQGLNKIDDRFLDTRKELVDLLIIVFQNSRAKELSFLETNEDLQYTLIDNFAEFYRHRTWLFIYSKHTFDEEKHVSPKLTSSVQYYKGDKILNYIFADSLSEDMIQVSDIIVGILGKYFTFINQVNSSNIEAELATLNSMQKDNLFKLLKLCKEAELYNKAFIHYTSSVINIRKDFLVSKISEDK